MKSSKTKQSMQCICTSTDKAPVSYRILRSLQGAGIFLCRPSGDAPATRCNRKTERAASKIPRQENNSASHGKSAGTCTNPGLQQSHHLCLSITSHHQHSTPNIRTKLLGVWLTVSMSRRHAPHCFKEAAEALSKNGLAVPKGCWKSTTSIQTGSSPITQKRTCAMPLNFETNRNQKVC